MKKCSGGVANLKTDNISEDNSIINVIHVTKKFGQAVVLNDEIGRASCRERV